MSIRYVLHQFCILVIVLSAVLLAVGAGAVARALWGADVEPAAAVALMISAVVGLVLGGGGWWATGRQDRLIRRREALLLVAASWIIGAALAALPFFLWAHLDKTVAPTHPFANFVNCYFESMSGLTTTGASVLSSAPSDIESLPASLLLWRSLIQWLGGLGIVVLFVAVLPSLGVGARKLFQVEAPGPSPETVRPHIRDTARLLWLIYLGLTAAQMVALKLAGMNWFDSACHTFTTLATGGFSTHNASIGGYNSASVDIVIILFMVLAGVNFAMYYQLIRGKTLNVFKDTELRTYLLFLLFGTLIVWLVIWANPIATTAEANAPAEMSAGASFRHSLFQMVSMQTTTGFCTADFDQWPFIAKAVLVLAMFFGASAGSTGGGIKVIRIIVALKVIGSEVERVFRPNVVRPVKVGNAAIDPELRLAAVAYVLHIILLFLTGAVLLMLLEKGAGIDFATAAGASVATLCNIGPGLAKVGAVENYGWFSDGSKLIMCILMALGRLEIFAIAVLFLPRFWRRD